MSDLLRTLATSREIILKQRFELAEAFGFETRNKYSIQDASGRIIGYAAEPSAGITDLLARGFLGHWRTYDIFLYSADREQVAIIHHPFRLFFQRLEVKLRAGKALGALQQQFTLLRRKFTVEGSEGQVAMTMEAGIFSIWTFPFYRDGKEVARVEKRWSGGLVEMLTDKDAFRVTFLDDRLSAEQRVVLLAAALFVDLQYFEQKAK